MVGVLACHSYPALHTLLQKVVEQLASLGPPSAMVVVVTTVLETITQLQSDTTHTSMLARLVMFLSWCLAQPSMKTVLCDKLTRHDLPHHGDLQPRGCAGKPQHQSTV